MRRYFRISDLTIAAARACFHTQMGAFGLKEDHHHVRVPLDRLVEARPCVDVHWLYREGLLLEGASARLETAYGSCRLATGTCLAAHDAGKIRIGNQTIATRPHGLIPSRVFVCPSCGAGRAQLYEHGGVWACRACHGLRYSSRHRHRSIPGLNRVLYLRRKIGAPLIPFTPIEPRSLHHRRYWRLAREIRALEARLIEHGLEIAEVLERRHAKRP